MTGIIASKPDNQINIAIVGSGALGQALASVYLDKERAIPGRNLEYKVTLLNFYPSPSRVLKEVQDGKYDFRELHAHSAYDHLAKGVYYDTGKREAGEGTLVIAAPEVTGSLDDSIQLALHEADVVPLAVTSDAVRPVLQKLVPYLKPGVPVVNYAKGWEMNDQGSKITITDPYHIMREELAGLGIPKFYHSGYMMYTNLLNGQLTLSMLWTGMGSDVKAGEKSRHEWLKYLSHVLSREDYGVIPAGSKGLRTVLLSGLIKPTIALSTGYLAGVEKNGRRIYESEGAKGALINAYLDSLHHFIAKFGGNPKFIFDPKFQAIGDDIRYTAQGPDSANYKAGLKRAQGMPVEEIKNQSGRSIEGFNQLPILKALIDIEPELDTMGLIPATHDIFFRDGMDVETLIRNLLHNQTAFSDGTMPPKKSFSSARSLIENWNMDRFGKTDPITIEKKVRK
ncbi:hypothetical protein J4227_06630 [Candidatus Woesearchaeota archaeon]|nr:hypothetical protein [Candidatus Woesearchaeota archaeon]